MEPRVGVLLVVTVRDFSEESCKRENRCGESRKTFISEQNNWTDGSLSAISQRITELQLCKTCKTQF